MNFNNFFTFLQILPLIINCHKNIVFFTCPQSFRDDWDSENLRACAYEAVNMIVTNSAEDMKAVVLQLLSEALNR